MRTCADVLAHVAGNGGSLDKCRRRWDLADREDLRYKFMNAFDRAMNHLDKAFGFIGAPHTCGHPSPRSAVARESIEIWQPAGMQSGLYNLRQSARQSAQKPVVFHVKSGESGAEADIHQVP